jgi:carboxymethylenebutenolidase
MNAHGKVASDIEGLSRQIDPFSRRSFFLASSAAMAAGYTLAAGPVRADAIHTDTSGLTAGDATIKVADGRCRPITRAPRAGRTRP